MALLHVADSASHLGAPRLLGVLAASAGVIVGAFFVFGMPAMLQRRHGGHAESDGDGDDGDCHA